MSDVKLETTSQPRPEPSPEIRRLIKLLDGTWDTAVRYEPSEAMPQGRMAYGRETSRPGPGGLSLVIEESSSNESAGGFEARGMIVWSQPEQAYKLYWFTNSSPLPAIFTGKWEGEKLIFNGMEQMMGQELASRHTVLDIQPDSFHYTIDMGPTPDKLKRVINITYIRAGKGKS